MTDVLWDFVCVLLLEIDTAMVDLRFPSEQSADGEMETAFIWLNLVIAGAE